MAKNRFGIGLKKNIFGVYLISPAIIVILFVLLWPLIQGIIYSFRHYVLTEPQNKYWVFFDNYIALFKDQLLLISLKNTFIYVTCSILGGLFIGLCVALLLNQKIVLQRVFRGIFLTPWIIAPVVFCLIFMYMFSSEVGIVNYVLQKLHLTRDFVQWFSYGTTAMLAVIIINIWAQFPFFFLMILAALQSIPTEVIEASVVDGTNIFQRFFHITLPYLKNIILITTTLMTIWNFNSFDIIWTLTKGGPVNATTTFSIFTYRIAFKNFDMGYASAIAVVWLIILTVFAYIYIRIMERGNVEF